MKAIKIVELKQRIARARSFERLAEIAVGHVIRDLGDKTHIVSGPISTGGVGSRTGNMARIKWTNDQLAQQFTIFDHSLFEDKIFALKKAWLLSGGRGYCWPILDTVYSRIFESGCIVELHLMPDWRSSTGSQWEKQTCQQLGIKVTDIPLSFYDKMPTLA
mgnify:FL=1